jgi:hypothetical protein
MTKAQLAAQHAYEAAHPISIWSTTEAQLAAWASARDAAIAAAGRSPTATAPVVHTPADPIAQAQAEAVAEAMATTAAVGLLLQEAGMEDMIGQLIGASPAQAERAISLRRWDEAWRRVDGGARSSAPASNGTNAQLWGQAFNRADEARVAAEPATTGSTPAANAGGSGDAAAAWDAAFDAVAR